MYLGPLNPGDPSLAEWHSWEREMARHEFDDPTLAGLARGAHGPPTLGWWATWVRTVPALLVLLTAGLVAGLCLL